MSAKLSLRYNSLCLLYDANIGFAAVFAACPSRRADTACVSLAGRLRLSVALVLVA